MDDSVPENAAIIGVHSEIVAFVEKSQAYVGWVSILLNSPPTPYSSGLGIEEADAMNRPILDSERRKRVNMSRVAIRLCWPRSKIAPDLGKCIGKIQQADDGLPIGELVLVCKGNEAVILRTPDAKTEVTGRIGDDSSALSRLGGIAGWGFCSVLHN
jgi:hypothetical protein